MRMTIAPLRSHEEGASRSGGSAYGPAQGRISGDFVKPTASAYLRASYTDLEEIAEQGRGQKCNVAPATTKKPSVFKAYKLWTLGSLFACLVVGMEKSDENPTKSGNNLYRTLKAHRLQPRNLPFGQGLAPYPRIGSGNRRFYATKRVEPVSHSACSGDCMAVWYSQEALCRAGCRGACMYYSF